MKRALWTALAIVEVVAVFVAAAFVARGLFAIPAVNALRIAWAEPLENLVFRWGPLVLLALMIDLVLRRRGLRAWGLWGDGRVFEPIAAARLLVLGGAAPLALTYFDSSPQSMASMFAGDWPAIAAAFAAPLLGQELFLVGYARRRFVDHAPEWLGVLLVMALFVLAHIEHASAGVLGLAFLAAMAWQGMWWALARRAGASLLTLMAAHLALLVAYERPLWGLIALGVLTLLTAYGAPRWIGTAWSSWSPQRV
jgi:hypothetical protein